MNKYFLVGKNLVSEIFTYRLNFVMWRVRMILSLLTIYFLWSALIPEGRELFGYTNSSILTYIILVHLTYSFVVASRSYAVGEDIIQGNLSNFLLKPFNYFTYLFSKDVGDKFMNISLTVIELSILFVILKPPIFIQTDLLLLLLTALSILSGIGIMFFIYVLLGSIGFWSQEVWAPRFIFFTIILNFFTGFLFPLDILPKPIFDFIQFLPFSYLLYFPVKIYLGQMAIDQILMGTSISLFWVVVFHLLLKKVWTKGLQIYGAYGR